MGFLKLLQSLDELLYEIMSWLIFYPVTLWRVIAHPWRMMRYARVELSDAPDAQYTDTLSPPLFLFLSLVLSHALELTLIGESKIVADTEGLAGLIDSDTNLILLRVMLFALFPLVLATNLVWRQKIALTRDTLRPPFYAQCYVAAPFALTVGIGGSLSQMTPAWGGPAGAAIVAGALLWFGVLQTRWYAFHLKTTHLRGFLHASLAMIECLAFALVVMLLFS